ncbi:hypothetical protein QR680_004013 [Steinernema hermaphroditum]|uniref:Uncharacterized protein n=1 Tax=Steinernema hermaphroditum TaxID=289476 RepID=A0AA39HNT4_9BILA|nr:hypothetical protein QR680_004013 [Steinernema hermaphroditum]
MPYIATVIDIHMVPDFINRMDYGFGYPVVILSALLVFLSLKLDPPFLCKMYCLNVAVPSFFYSFVFLFPDIIKSMGLKSVWEILIGPATSIRVHLRYYALCNYPYFSTLTIFLAYLGYAKPMFFRKLIKRRNITLMVGAIHLWTLLSVFFFLPREITIFYYKMSESDFSAVTIVHTFIVLSCSVFMSAVYILAIIEMLRHANGDSASAIGHRNTLKSVLIYCTAPNFFCAFALSGYICLTVFEVKGYLRPSHWRSPSDVSHWVLSEKFCGPVVTTTETLGSTRLFVNVFTALIAFQDYRSAIMNAVFRVATPILRMFGIVRSTKASTAPIRSVATVSPGNSLSELSVNGVNIQSRHK